MDNRLNYTPLAWREHLSRLTWRRAARREDDSRPIMAQLLHPGYRWWAANTPFRDRPWITQQPRVRMDIQTAVQIASLSEFPMGLAELLTETAAVELEPLGLGPLCPHEVAISRTVDAVSHAVDVTNTWRIQLTERLRVYRETRRQDNRAFERRVKNRMAMARESRLINRLDITLAVLGVALFIAFARLMAYIWSNGL